MKLVRALRLRGKFITAEAVLVLGTAFLIPVLCPNGLSGEAGKDRTHDPQTYGLMLLILW